MGDGSQLVKAVPLCGAVHAWEKKTRMGHAMGLGTLAQHAAAGESTRRGNVL